MTDDNPYYRVSLSGIAESSLEHLATRAASAGRLNEFLASVLRTIRWLEADPETVGEPVIDYKSLKLTFYTGVVEGLIVRYTIHFESRQVFVNQPFDLSRWLGY